MPNRFGSEHAASQKDGPNIQESHLIFMETLAKIWPLTLERKHRMSRRENCDSLNDEQGLLVDEAEMWYKRTLWIRSMMMRLYNDSPNHRASYDAKSCEDPIWWIDHFAWAFDPRLPPIGLKAIVPMVLWPEQKRMLSEFHECYKNRIPFLVEKSRETGITWTFVNYMLHHLIYSEGFSGTLASREAGQVDERGNMNTLFGKVRHSLYLLPKVMRPESLRNVDGMNDKLMNICNVEKQSALIGEGGDNIGRGGRSSMTFIDESAFLEHPEGIDSALSSNTNCQLDVSTPNGMNNFYRKRMGGGTQVFTMRWWKDPSKNTEWREDKKPDKNAWYEFFKEKNQHDPTIVAREVDIDYNASVEGVFIPAEWVRAAVGFDLDCAGDRVAGFDVAAGGKNEAVYQLRIGPVAMPCKPLRFKSSSEAIFAAVGCGSEDGIILMNYDFDGIGESVVGLLKAAGREIPFKLNGVRGGAGADDGVIEEDGLTGKQKYRNKRAENWDRLRQRFRKTYEQVNGIRVYSASELISIPDDPVLQTQLSSPKQKPTTSGKIQVESKAEMRSRGIESPDRADALVYAFADYDESDRVVEGFDYTAGAHYKDFKVDFDRGGSLSLISLVQLEDLSVHAVCCLWWPSFKRPLLQVYGEYVQNNADAMEVVRDLREIAENEKKKVGEWIGNDEMFEDRPGGKLKPWFLYRKAGVSLHRNYSNDEAGATMLLNQMFSRGLVDIHVECDSLMLQLTNMTRSNPTSAGLVRALCQLVTRLRKKKLLPSGPVEGQYHKGAYGHFGRTSVEDRKVQKALVARRIELADVVR